MPHSKKVKLSKPSATPKVQKPPGKMGSRKRIGRSEGDEIFLRFGRKIRRRIKVNRRIPTYAESDEVRAEVFDRFVTTQGAMKSNASVNRTYRAAWKGMDEIFSTASTRELVRGILDEEDVGELTDGEWEYLRELIDLLSNLRLKTKYTGYATEDEVMQHPTRRVEAIYADPYTTASEHAIMDGERRDYIIRAMEESLEAEELDARDLVVIGARSSIEFTLNYFSAPISADGVQDYTRLAGVGLDDPRIQEQLAGRERLKVIYQQLGGRLRDLEEPETADAAQTRAWQQGQPAGTTDDPYPFAPPSPERQVNQVDYTREDPPTDLPGMDLYGSYVFADDPVPGLVFPDVPSTGFPTISASATETQAGQIAFEALF